MRAGPKLENAQRNSFPPNVPQLRHLPLADAQDRVRGDRRGASHAERLIRHASLPVFDSTDDVTPPDWMYRDIVAYLTLREDGVARTSQRSWRFWPNREIPVR